MARSNGKDRGLFERPAGSGTWWIRYHDALGNEHREKVGPKSLARQAYAKRKTQIREGQFFPQTVRHRTILLSTLIQSYLQEAETNHRSFRSDLNHANYWTTIFGDVPIEELTPADLEKWKAGRLANRKPATVNRELAWLKRLYNVAIRDGKVEKNPVKAIKLLRLNNARVRFLNDAEELALKAVLEPIDFEIVEVALHSGMRRSELFNLRWEDVDLRNLVITIPLSKHGGKRYVPVNVRVMEILKSRHKKRASIWVFPSQNPETPLDANNWVRRIFTPALRLAGIRQFTFHCCRHTTASRLVMAGVDIRTVQEILGHLDISVTLKYSHLAPSHIKEAINRLVKP